MRAAICCFASTLTLLSAGCKMVAPSPPPNHNVSTAIRLTVPDHMIQYGCPACHVIPGVPGAVGKVGPPLDGLVQRSYLAGNLANTPENLERWIMHPQHYQPGTAMPEMNVSAQDAGQFAAFLEPTQ